MVFNKENGGYTENATALSTEFRDLVKDLIVKFANEKDMPIEEILYITSRDVESICLRNQIEQRKKWKTFVLKNEGLTPHIDECPIREGF